MRASAPASLTVRHRGDTLRVVVLASGSGTLLQAMLDDLGPSVEIVAVGADRPCAALERAGQAGVPVFREDYNPDRVAGYDREGWNTRLAGRIAAFSPDVVVSAGFMRILGAGLVDRFRGRIINTHPALLPSFPGAHAVPDALAYGVTLTGSTVHIVDDGVDTGPIIAQRAVPVLRDDTEETLHERIKTVERALIVDVLHQTAESGYTIEGRKAWIND
ncbi:phosphoribosylglycinamide formyltransferase [Corynebacterium sp.]|uniref:phosphoribosylglycinamide formyltransferase n=1 Tax=Corynebacterium sp. TaxID=1720 RepID=UPI0025C2621D|nr:phosphoribosylglycinamide formyltransferase [Corynebacterium sp.]